MVSMLRFSIMPFCLVLRSQNYALQSSALTLLQPYTFIIWVELYCYEFLSIFTFITTIIRVVTTCVWRHFITLYFRMGSVNRFSFYYFYYNQPCKCASRRAIPAFIWKQIAPSVFFFFPWKLFFHPWNFLAFPPWKPQPFRENILKTARERTKSIRENFQQIAYVKMGPLYVKNMTK